jgi:DNA-binding NarL/FixJ family response regulator
MQEHIEIIRCNCISQIHQRGSEICRYYKPIPATTQVVLEELLLGTSRRNIAHKLNLTTYAVNSAIYRVSKRLGTRSSLECARIAKHLGWLQL